MNERIKELAAQVEKYISTTNFEGMPEDEMTYDEIFQKKFAELIVGECYLWAKENGGLGCEEDFEALKEHFGVEE
jgi:hypothetical protein